MSARALEFVWMPDRGLKMLTGSLSEDTHPKSSQIVRLSRN